MPNHQDVLLALTAGITGGLISLGLYSLLEERRRACSTPPPPAPSSSHSSRLLSLLPRAILSWPPSLRRELETAADLALTCGAAMIDCSGGLGVSWKDAVDPVTRIDEENEGKGCVLDTSPQPSMLAYALHVLVGLPLPVPDRKRVRSLAPCLPTRFSPHSQR